MADAAAALGRPGGPGSGAAAIRAVQRSPHRRLRPDPLDTLKQALPALLRQVLFGAGSPGQQLWDQGLVSRLLAAGYLGGLGTPLPLN